MKRIFVILIVLSLLTMACSMDWWDGVEKAFDFIDGCDRYAPPSIISLCN